MLHIVPASTVPCPHNIKALLHLLIPAFALSSSLFSKLFSLHSLSSPSISSLSCTLWRPLPAQHEWHRAGTRPRCWHHLLSCLSLQIPHLNHGASSALAAASRQLPASDVALLGLKSRVGTKKEATYTNKYIYTHAYVRRGVFPNQFVTVTPGLGFFRYHFTDTPAQKTPHL